VKRAALLSLLILACHNEPVVNTDTMDTRAPIAIRYVGAPELVVHDQPSETAAVLAKYQNGESISVLTEKGEWVEVRTGDRTGWAHAADLTSAAEKKAQEENPQARFRVMPMTISAPRAHGELYLEASVNTDGEVTDVRLIMNTTGSEALAQQTAEALRGAKFYPMVQKNERKPFKYYHRVTY